MTLFHSLYFAVIKWGNVCCAFLFFNINKANVIKIRFLFFLVRLVSAAAAAMMMVMLDARRIDITNGIGNYCTNSSNKRITIHY